MPNLDTLKGEIEQYLEEQGFAVFRGFPRVLDTSPLVYWDCDRIPITRLFVKPLQSGGVKTDGVPPAGNSPPIKWMRRWSSWPDAICRARNSTNWSAV